MNHLKSTELADHSGYHYTVTNDGRTRIHSCCAAHDRTPHATAEEADRCYYEYQLGRAIESKSGGSAAYKCSECSAWTQGLYVIGGYDTVHLCDEHRTPDMLRKHHPFTPGMTSWES